MEEEIRRLEKLSLKANRINNASNALAQAIKAIPFSELSQGDKPLVYSQLVWLQKKLSDYLREASQVEVSVLPSGTDYLSLWQQTVGTAIRTNPPGNLAAAVRLEREVGSERLTDLLRAVRMIHADRYASRTLWAVNNYITLERNLEKVEIYIQGIKDRKGFEQNINRKDIPSI